MRLEPTAVGAKAAWEGLRVQGLRALGFSV